MLGHHLDLSSPPPSSPPAPRLGQRRHYVGIHFACCDVYVRVYLRHDRQAAQTHCPRCWRRVMLQFDAAGSTARFLQAG